MPFLHKHIIPRSRELEEKAKKNGLHHSVFFNEDKYYLGEWKNDKQNGIGIKVLGDKTYHGGWVDGKRQGYGELTRKEGVDTNYIYIGNYWQGKLQGKGNKFYKDGSIYNGEWQEGMRNGVGRMWYKDGSFYIGKWKDNKQEGRGTMIFTNGDEYDGFWQCNKRHGLGVYHHKKTGQVQKGLWKEDLCVCSTIADSDGRQTAPSPTRFPIPKILLDNADDIFKNELIIQLQEMADNTEN